MPRLVAEDYLQSFRFRVVEIDGGAGALESPVAGFNNVTTPEITVESAEHRTGNETWTKKQPGVPTVESATLTRGILIGDSTMYDWVVNKLFDKLPFRTDLQINQYNQEKPGVNPDDEPSRTITLREAFPTRVKLMGDLDATSSDINIQEIEVAVEEVVLSKA
jgi:phage tail-like protein